MSENRAAVMIAHVPAVWKERAYLGPVELGPNNAERIIAALDAAGYVIVPKEPSEEMSWDGAVIGGPQCTPYDATAIYRAMLAASQQKAGQ